MRSISADALAKILTEKGIEPVLVLKVQWVRNGPNLYYSDRAFDEPLILGKILSFGNIDNVTKITGSGQSQSISVVLDDTDGSFKNLIDNHDIHKRSATILQWFTGIPFSDAFILFKGQISSPISWKEAERSLSFDIVSKLEDNEVGFSAEEGQFPIVPHDLIGKAWPLGFGTNVRVPALQLNKTPEGTSVDQIAFPDPDLIHKIYDNERGSSQLHQASQINGINAAKATRFKILIQADIDAVLAAIAAIQDNPDGEIIPPVLGQYGEGQSSPTTEPGTSSHTTQPYQIQVPENTRESEDTSESVGGSF